MVQEIGLANIEREINFGATRLHKLFERMHENGLEYLILRDIGGDRKYSRMQEVDLLIRDSQWSILDRVLDEMGFISYPAWGYEPHRFYFSFDPELEKWLKIDAIDRIRYGRPFKDVVIPVASLILDDRIKENGLYKPQMVDEFLTLLLHSCLDKPVMAHKHKVRLLELLKHIANDETQRRLLAERAKLYGFRSDMLKWVQAILAHRWSWLRKRTRRIYYSMYVNHLFVNLGFAALSRINKRLRVLLFMLKRHGTIIALIAPDGAGKSTLAKNLKMWWPWPVKILYMGQNPQASTIGLPTSNYLKSVRKKGLGRILWFINRVLENWLRHSAALFYKWRGRLVIMDRFPFRQDPSEGSKHWMKSVSRTFLGAFQTRPDLAIFLDAPANVLYERKGEHTIELLEKQRRALKKKLDDVPNVSIIDAQSDADTVTIKVCDILQRHYRRLYESGPN